MRKTVLLAIDDDEGDLELLGRLIEGVHEWDVEFLPFTSPTAALAVLADREVDVVFLDHYLGDRTSVDIIKALRAQGDDRPIIAFTGQSDQRVTAEIMLAGATDYLPKNALTPDMLRRAVENARAQYLLRREKRILEESLRHAQRMESIGHLAGGLAHDFNNLLTGIMGRVELALLRRPGGELEDDLRHVQTTCVSMAELIQHLMSFGRRDVSGAGPVSITQLVTEIDTVLTHTLPKNITIMSEVPDDALLVNGNANQLKQVLLNLCINGAEAMPDGGRLSIHVRRFKPDVAAGDQVEIVVQDSGVGMEPSVLEQIFEPFFTTKTLTSRKGTGLGLAIVWQNVHDHDGRIDVSSEPGCGATFRVYLPLLKSESADRPEPKLDAMPHGTETLLVVDDEALIRSIMTVSLERLGYRILCAGDGAEAIAQYQEDRENIAAIILDISMPVMNGDECLRRLVELDPQVKVIMSSGHDLAAWDTELIEIGAKAFIQKPYSLTDLAQTVRRVLDA